MIRAICAGLSKAVDCAKMRFQDLGHCDWWSFECNGTRSSLNENRSRNKALDDPNLGLVYYKIGRCKLSVQRTEDARSDPVCMVDS